MTLSERMTALEREKEFHAEWLRDHQRAIARHDSEMAELRDISRQRDERLDARIDKLVSAIGEFISRIPKPGQ